MPRLLKEVAGVRATGTVHTYCIHPSPYVRDKFPNHKHKIFKSNNRTQFFLIGEGVGVIQWKEKSVLSLRPKFPQVSKSYMMYNPTW